MLDYVNNTVWMVTSILIFISGIYFTFKIKFQQFNFKKMFSALKEKSSENGISPMQTLTVNLAAKIGVGSITGIALAIYTGGVGTIFWMWITAIIASSNTFVESVLGVKYREKDEGNIYKGGPSFYIEKGLKKKKLARVYSYMIIFAFVIGFITIQSNTIVVGITDKVAISPIIIGIGIVLLTALVIVNGIKSIANVTNFLVPFMSIIYIIICFIILFLNASSLPSILVSIFKEAFNFKSAGIGVLTTFLIGMQKGLFSNEAGLGTGAIAAGTSDTDNPMSQGYIQSLGIYIDTLIIGTLSALVVMCSDFSSLNLLDANGIEIVKFAFESHLGDFGGNMVVIIIFLFAFSTIITGYYYGESSLKYIKKDATKKDLLILKIATLILLFVGCLLSSGFIWTIVDIFVAVLAIINIYALWKLRDKI